MFPPRNQKSLKGSLERGKPIHRHPQYKLYAFSKHNICTCYNCSTSKKKYESFIKEETLREFKAKKQLIFDFIEQ